MPNLRVHNFSISLDGYAAGPDQSLQHPLGVGGEALHDWAVATRAFRRVHGGEGGAAGLDDDFVARGDAGIGATIMGRNMFGPVRGPWADEAWTGWWGDDPPFHHPVFVLTHHPRAPLAMRSSRSCSAAASASSTASTAAPLDYECVDLACSGSVAHVRLARNCDASTP